MKSIAQFFGGLVVGFVYGWRLTLVVLALLPVLLSVTLLFSTIMTKFAKLHMDANANASGLAEETFAGIRTVTAFSGQQEEVRRYTKSLFQAEKAKFKTLALSGLVL